MTKKEIKDLACRKHIKIYLLSKVGLNKQEISKEVGTNYGHVYNVLKDYKDHPEKAEHAERLLIQEDAQ